MPAFMDNQIHVVEKKKTCAVRRGIDEEQEIEAHPADPRIPRNRLPLSEIIFQEGHSGKRSRQGRTKTPDSKRRCRNSSAGVQYLLLLNRRQRLIGRAQQRGRLIKHDGNRNVRQQILKMTFFLECSEKSPILDLLD